MITDAEYRPVYRTQTPLRTPAERLSEALSGPVFPDEDTRLSGRPIRAGFAFWEEDESMLHRLRNRLEEANETLGLENKLLQYEHAQKNVPTAAC